ncbi:MAG: Ig-like domain-containing protein [Muribaculaceae bacterium]|nr:Ig-like domain-containing protein [Muribaculaceae bacterium]
MKSINSIIKNRKKGNHKNIVTTPAVLILMALAVSCASIGTPTGGPRDEDAPRFVRANPAPGSLNVTRQRIDIDFDEIINVKDAFTKVVVSPPSAQVPRVSSNGHRVTVQFQDTLRENTTYTIDFGNSIEDNNEGNKLPSFAYTFSTGPEIDTLQISGMVLSAESLEPQQGMLVGVYSNLSDTAFSTLPFERMAKTDDRGRFSILGLAPGEYRIFALNDLDNDYHRANPEEAAAFYDVLLSPTSERAMTTDTLFNLKNGEVDTIISRERTLFLPNDILLRSFESDVKSQYLTKYERQDSTRLNFFFNTRADSLPKITPVGLDSLQNWYVVEKSQRNDSVTFWITEPSILSLDSLRIAATYLRTDSAKNLTEFTDTLRFFYSRDLKTALANAAKEREKELKEKEKTREKEREQALKEGIEWVEDTTEVAEKPTPLGFRVTSSSTQEVYLPLFFEFDTPLTRLDTNAFHLEVMVDTLWQPVKKDYRAQRLDSLNPRKFKIEFPWDYSTQYRLSVDSLAATGIYGLETDPLEYTFKTKSEDDYSSVVFTISNFTDTIPAFIELLNTSDNPVRREKVVDNKAIFKYLPAGKYYARIFEDHNGNGIFDTGLLDTDNPDSIRQPDYTYYYPKLINLKKNWDREESWDVFSIAVDQMKPYALLKNKPEADKKNRNRNRNNGMEEDEEEEEYFDPTRNPFDPNDRGNGRRY